MARKPLQRRLLEAAASMPVMIAATSLLIVLTFVCTLDQVNLGTFAAVDKYFRSFFLWADIGGYRIPVFFGGGVAGLLLLVATSAAFAVRFRWDKQKAGIWLSHAGLILLIASEFVTGFFAVESQLPIEEGASMNYSEAYRIDEFVVSEVTGEFETVYAIEDKQLRSGKSFEHADWPFSVHLRRYFPNAVVGSRPPQIKMPTSVVDRGIGSKMVLRPLSEVSLDDARNMRAAFVDIKEKGQRVGTWLISSQLGAQQRFTVGGRQFSIAMRARRYYHPFTVKLKDFKHDRYAGTDIPKNFSSLIRLIDPERGEDRDALIYMNHPLRYRGLTFFQASFGKDDTLSVLQVVRNPGWLIPYIACLLMGVGMLIQFLLSLKRFSPAR
jgi:hypothetical protein